MRNLIYLLIGVVVLLFIAGCAAQIRSQRDQYDSGALLSHTVTDGVLELNYENMSARFSFVNGGVIHFEASYSPVIPHKHDYAVVSREIDVSSAVTEKNGEILFARGDISVRIRKRSFQATVSQNEKHLYSFGVFSKIEGETLYAVSRYKNERFFGLGGKTGDFELTGRSFEMYNKDTYRYDGNTDPIYSSFPFYITFTDNFQYGVFFDSPARSFFNFKADDYSYSVVDDKISLYVFTGDTKDIIGDYTVLTGKPYMPPLWAMGYHQSRYSYTNQAQFLSVAESFRNNNLPLEVLYLDIGFMDSHKPFTYDPVKFPNPVAMIRELHRDGVKIVAIVDPGIKVDEDYEVYTSGEELDVYCKYRERPYRGAVWPGMCNFPDYSLPRAIEWWGDWYKVLTDMGIDGFWNDMNEPSVFSGPNGTMPPGVMHYNFGNPVQHKYIHNVYGLTMIEATMDGITRINPSERHFILTRSAYSGAQRSSFLWTGDNTANWEHLRMNVSMILNLGLSGMPYCGADIGGYTGSPSAELMVRWNQLGTFIPFMRNHTETGTRFQEPYNFTENIDILRKYISLRYKLMAYLYTEVYKTHISGLPIAKPLFLNYGRDFLDEAQAFLFGDDILVVPVLERRAETVTVTIPDGLWYDFHGGDTFKGGTHTIPVTLEDIPVFVRGGSIVSLYAKDARNTSQLKDADIRIVVYPDNEGRASGVLYEDDGKSHKYLDGQYLLSEFDIEIREGVANVRIKHSGDYVPKRKLTFKFSESVTEVNITE